MEMWILSWKSRQSLAIKPRDQSWCSYKAPINGGSGSRCAPITRKYLMIERHPSFVREQRVVVEHQQQSQSHSLLGIKMCSFSKRPSIWYPYRVAIGHLQHVYPCSITFLKGFCANSFGEPKAQSLFCRISILCNGTSRFPYLYNIEACNLAPARSF